MEFLRKKRRNPVRIWMVWSLFMAGGRWAISSDCNGNDIEDSVDIAPPEFHYSSPPLYPAVPAYGKLITADISTAGLPIPLVAADLNRDGKADLAFPEGVHNSFGFTPPAFYGLSVVLNRTDWPASADLNRNAVPDECEGRPFHSGDVDTDGELIIDDPIVLLRFLFLSSGSLSCLEAADADNYGSLEITDGIRLLRYLFLVDAPPTYPGPPVDSCGLDPDPPVSPQHLGCESYAPCAGVD